VDKNQHQVKNDEDTFKRDEDRLDSFLRRLFLIDSGAAVFFLVVRGDILGVGRLPFQLAFYPFKTQVCILLCCAGGTLLLEGLKLFFHNRLAFQRLSIRIAFVLLVLTIVAIVWAGWIITQNPELLPDGKQ
jgi:hypothetical protein